MANPKTRGRMITKDISVSRKFGSLSTHAKILFTLLIPHYDSHGKMMGGAGYIKETVCPFVEELTIDTIPTLLQEISEKTNVKYFEFAGRWWIHSLKFSNESPLCQVSVNEQGHQRLDKNRIGEDQFPDYPGVMNQPSAPSARVPKKEQPLDKDEDYEIMLGGGTYFDFRNGGLFRRENGKTYRCRGDEWIADEDGSVLERPSETPRRKKNNGIKKR